MPTKVLTARAVAVAKPKRAAGKLVRAEIPDAGCPGLYLIVEPTGARSWAHRYRLHGKSRKDTLGSALEDGLSLAAARHAVAAARHRLGQGMAPAQGSALDLRGPVAATTDSIEAAVASFLELHAYRKTRRNSAQATEYSFNRFVLPAWRGRKVADITRREVIDLVETVAAKTPYAANRLLAALSKFFGWLVARDALTLSPVAGVERPHREVARQHVLNDAQLRALWRACEGEGAFGTALRLLILTGARRNEVSALVWSELDFEHHLWRLPAARSKNGHACAIPLPVQAWALLEARPEINGSPYVFTTDGRTPINGWAKAKARISAKADLDPAGWRLHDLRRSVASGMQRLGVMVPVVEKALNHAGGVFRGIVSTYQTHDYADDVRAAFQLWGEHVERLVAGKPAKVVKLRRR